MAFEPTYGVMLAAVDLIPKHTPDLGCPSAVDQGLIAVDATTRLAALLPRCVELQASLASCLAMLNGCAGGPECFAWRSLPCSLW
jgi:hypothetical protein